MTYSDFAGIEIITEKRNDFEMSKGRLKILLCSVSIIMVFSSCVFLAMDSESLEKSEDRAFIENIEVVNYVEQLSIAAGITGFQKRISGNGNGAYWITSFDEFDNYSSASYDFDSVLVYFNYSDLTVDILSASDLKDKDLWGTLVATDEKLFFFHPNKIIITDLDGANANIITIPQSMNLSLGLVISDGKSLFFLVGTSPKNNHKQGGMYSINSDGDLFKVCNIDSYNAYYSITGYCAEGIVITKESVTNGSNRSIDEVALAEERDKSLWVFDPQDNTGRLVEHGSDKFCRIINNGMIVDNYSKKIYEYDSSLVSADQSNRLIEYDILTGKTRMINWWLYDSIGSHVYDYAVSEEYYFFEVGTVPFSPIDKKGKAIIEFVLIDKEDFFNSEPEYIRFDYSSLLDQFTRIS